MPIRDVTSSLPDPDYIRALEEELAELRKIAERAFQLGLAADRR